MDNIKMLTSAAPAIFFKIRFIMFAFFNEVRSCGLILRETAGLARAFLFFIEIKIFVYIQDNTF